MPRSFSILYRIVVLETIYPHAPYSSYFHSFSILYRIVVLETPRRPLLQPRQSSFSILYRIVVLETWTPAH